jgi:transposase
VAWKRLADHQWEAIRKQLPPPPPRPHGGRPRVGSRRCLEGILWIAWTGAQWAALPECYGARSAVHDRLVAKSVGLIDWCTPSMGVN